MKTLAPLLCVLALGCGLAPGVEAATQQGSSGPYDGSTFRGRILISADGNLNDEDDWGAFPVAIAILDAMGLKGRLVHAHFNNILWANDERFEAEMRTSALGAQQRYGLPAGIFYDVQDAARRSAAIQSIRDEINRSTSTDPLYMILTGPMDLAYQGIVQSDPAKRRYVVCISHNNWNDGYGNGDPAQHDKRDVIPTGITWVQIRDGNPLLAFGGTPGSTSTAANWAKVDWMKNSSQANLRWVHSRLVAEGRVDVSDATVTYFLVSGDETCDLPKLQNLLDRRVRPAPILQRTAIRMEAENFITLQNYAVVHGDKTASQRLKVVGKAGAVCRMSTAFREPYAALDATYEIEVRYRDVSGGRSTFQLRVNGANAGSSWTASADNGAWASRRVGGVRLRQGDAIEVEGRAEGAELAEIDYVGLALQAGPPPTGTGAVTSFTLVNAQTDADIGPLPSGAVLDLSTLPSALNVRANTSGSVGSVRFALDGNPNFRTESAAPYALAGDTAGDYWPWTPSVGSHGLTATPWSGAGATGTAGTARTVTFTVVGQASASLQAEGPSPASDEAGLPPACGATGAELLLLLLALGRRRSA
jgi:hypothetical protein